MYFNRPDGSKAYIPRTLKVYREAGYKVLDMNFHDCAMFKTPMWGNEWLSFVNEVKDEAEKNGLVFGQGHSHFYNYCQKDIENKEFLDEQIRRDIVGAGILNIKWLVFHAATDWDSVTEFKSSKEKAISYFKGIVELAEKNNVGIALENLWEENIAPKRRYCSFAEELVDLVDTIDSPRVGICWDFEHSAIMKQDVRKAIKYVGKRLKATHISDYYDKVYDHVLPYNGVENVDEMLWSLAENDYQGDFSFETHRHTMNLPDELVAPAIKYSYEVGIYLVNRINEFKERIKSE